MGQKVHPYGFRLGVTKTWRSRWFATQDYAKLLMEDIELKRALHSRLKSAGVSSVEVDRPGNKLRITIRTSRPGIVIGRKGAEIEKLKGDLARKTKREVFIDIQEVHKPELDAQLVAESIALQLEKRVAFRRAMRKAVDSALRFGCKGIKVRVSGRLNGSEIARSEWYLQGQLPLHTLRADIDYGFAEAHTTYGIIGVKAWIYKGEILGDSRRVGLKAGDPEPRPRRDRRDRREGGGGRDDRGGFGDRGGYGDRGGRPPAGRPGGYSQGGYNQGGYNQGGYNQGGSQGGAQGGYNRPAGGGSGVPASSNPASSNPTSSNLGGSAPTSGNQSEGRATGPVLPPLAQPQPNWKQDEGAAPQDVTRENLNAEATLPEASSSQGTPANAADTGNGSENGEGSKE